MANMPNGPDDFATAVVADVKGTATEAQKEMLAGDLTAWTNSLVTLMRDVDIQFSAHKSTNAAVRQATHDSGDESRWLAHVANDQEWKLKTNRFKASIEARLRYVKSLRVQSS